ncbi:MAG: HAD family hydrolase [Halioglobus sp.]
MTLAIFDLDNTLIAGDSDHLWGQFVCELGIVNEGDFAAQNEAFYRDYQAGSLDINAYLRFALGPLKGRSPELLNAWHEQFMEEKIEPLLLPRAAALIADHRKRGHVLMIVTATNSFVTGPIASRLGIHHLLACEGEKIEGVYTGEPEGVPSYHEGKVTRVNTWLKENELSLDGAWFYSDSHNDLPLLQQVDNPVAVDPDPILRAQAQQRGWPVISLRDP